MNYYPNNFYPNYSYNNQYNQNQQQPISALQGKIVDSLDIVKATEVPFGGFGVFPKGDLSEIYIKSWNNNGTTQVNVYKPAPIEEVIQEHEVSGEEILKTLTVLNQKIDSLMNNTPAAAASSKENSSTIKKDVSLNAY